MRLHHHPLPSAASRFVAARPLPSCHPSQQQDRPSGSIGRSREGKRGGSQGGGVDVRDGPGVLAAAGKMRRRRRRPPPLPVLCMIIARPAAAVTSKPTRPTTLDQPIGQSLDFSLSSAVGARMGMPRQPPPKTKTDEPVSDISLFSFLCPTRPNPERGRRFAHASWSRDRKFPVKTACLV